MLYHPTGTANSQSHLAGYSLSFRVSAVTSFTLGSLLLCSPVPTYPQPPQTPQSHTPELCPQVVLAQTSPRGNKLPTSQGHDPSEDLYLHRATSTSSQSPPKMGMTGGAGKHRVGEEGPIPAQVPGRIWKPPGTQRTVQEGRVLGLDSGN